MRLPDGTICPHYMGVEDTSTLQVSPAFFDEIRLMVGEVVDIIYPEDAQNSTSKFTEYVVGVWRKQGNGPLERLLYRCSQADAFGSVGDWFRFTYRKSTNSPYNNDSSDTEATSSPSLTNGATVLVACVNGDRSNAVIIAGWPQPNRKQADPSRADGRASRMRFNGVEMRVSDDGSFELMVPGATDTDGKPDPARDSNNHGSKLSFSANGDITIDDQNGDSVRVSPGSKTIAIESGEKLTEKTDTEEVQASSSWKLTAPKVVVISPNVNIGEEQIPLDNGAVFGEGVDTFTGLTYFELENASKTVRVAK